MENAERQRAITGTLSDAELSALLELCRVNIDKASPLAATFAAARSGDGSVTARLQQSGFLEPVNPARPTPQCVSALNTVAKPDVVIKLVWGDAARVNLSGLYATTAAGSGAMVAFNRDAQGRNSISYFASHDDLTGLVRDRIAFSELKKTRAPMSLEAEAAALPVLFAVLDLHREARLKAALDRTPAASIDLSAGAIKRVLLDAKTSPSFDWYAALGYMMFPRELPPDDSHVISGVRALEKKDALTVSNNESVLASGLEAFAFRAFPVISYFGATISTRPGSEFAGAQFGLIRSLETLLLVERASDSAGERFRASSISTSDVPELLFNLFTMPFEVRPTPPQASGQATATNFCRKCGDAVKAGEKFCDKCGTKLA